MELKLQRYASLENNPLDTTTDWIVGTTGSTLKFDIAATIYGAYATETRQTSTGPYGESATVWDSFASTGLTSHRGGWLSDKDYTPINITKTYRMSLWIKRMENCASTIYYGFTASNSSKVDVASTKLSDGSDGTNCYAIALAPASDYFPNDEWKLAVFFVKDSASPTGVTYTRSAETGLYTTGGTYTALGNDYRWKSDAAYFLNRMFSPFATAPFTANGHFQYVYPRFDLVDGTEPPIRQLLGLSIGRPATDVDSKIILLPE